MECEQGQRVDTEITNEYYSKYREDMPIGPGSLFYGKDSEMLYKTWTGAKRGAIIGLGVGIMASTYQKQPFSFAVAAEKGFKHGMPWVIAGTTYGLGLSLAANIRNKEGPENHVIGGYAAGTMVGAWYKSIKAGVWTGILLGALAGIYKMTVDNDNQFKGRLRRPRVFTFYKRGWMTERPPQEGRGDDKGDDYYKPYRA